MPEPDKNKIPRSLKDPEITGEQIAINALVTTSAALTDIAESVNDICSNLDIIRELEVKRALKDDIINPVEAEELEPKEDEEDESST